MDLRRQKTNAPWKSTSARATMLSVAIGLTGSACGQFSFSIDFQGPMIGVRKPGPFLIASSMSSALAMP